MGDPKQTYAGGVLVRDGRKLILHAYHTPAESVADAVGRALRWAQAEYPRALVECADMKLIREGPTDA
jgi:hypothetical protein